MPGIIVPFVGEPYRNAIAVVCPKFLDQSVVQLFRKVLDRYMDGPVAWFGKALAAPKARDVVEEIFLGTARMADDPSIPAGCLMVQGALACGDASVRKEVAARRVAAEVALRRRLQRAKREGDLPKNAGPAELAH